MYIREILNKWDQNILRFLIILSQNGYQMSKQEISDELSLTRPTLLKLVKEVEDIFAMLDGYELRTSKDSYILDISLEKNLDHLLIFLLRYSRKYQILMTMFEDSFVNMNYFCDVNRISKNIYYSELKDLNLMLAEFDLEITNNYMVGAESQIRQFYAALFAKTLPMEKLKAITDTSVPENFFEALAAVFEVKLDQAVIHELALYFYVTNKRYEKRQCQDVAASAGIANRAYAPDKSSAFLSSLRSATVLADLSSLADRFFHYNHWLNDPEEQQLLMLFLMGRDFAATDSSLFQELLKLEQKADGYVQEVVDCFLHQTETELPPPLRQNHTYLLSKAIWQHLFFKGMIYIDRDDAWVRYQNELELAGQQVVFEQIMTQVGLGFPGLTYGDAADETLLAGFGISFNDILQEALQPFKIGLYFVGNQSVVKTLREYYLRELNKFTAISAELWAPKQEFDLIVSNYELREEANHAKVFYTSFSNLEFIVDYIIKYVRKIMQNNME